MTSSSLTVLIEGIPKVIDKTHANFTKIVEAVLEGNQELVIKLSDISSAITTYGDGKVVVKDGVVLFDGVEVHNYAVDKLLEFMSEDLPIQPIVNFLDNLMSNPSYRAVQELYKFLEVGQMPLTEDGHFLAYKKVRGNYKDIHSGTFDNSVGAICEMPRNQVNEDSNITCSTGLHVCSFDYLSHFGGSNDKVVVCKINPRDVVSIPRDYDNTKMRLCRYEVIQDVTEQYYGKRNVLSETTLYAEPSKLKSIHQYAEDGSLVGMYADAPTAEKASGIWSQNILKCTRGERMSAGGFTWELK